VTLAATDNFGLSYLLEWIGLAICALVIWRYVWPPLRRLMNDQRERIQTELSAGEEAKSQAEALVAERRAALEQARGEAAGIVEQARRSAEGIVEDGRRRAEEERARTVGRAELEITAARARVRAEVISEVGRVVVAAAESVVEAELDDADQRRLIDGAIDATADGAVR
jgi:F-type H+-transporting ATPase subunit b